MATDDVFFFTPTEHKVSGVWKFSGAATAANGKIVFVPLTTNATLYRSVIKLYPLVATLQLVGVGPFLVSTVLYRVYIKMIQCEVIQ